MVTHVAHARPAAGIRRIGALAGMAGPVLFSVTFLAQNALRTDDDVIAEPVSALEAGELGWIQQTNFVVFGCLVLLFALGLHRELGRTRPGTIGPALLGLAGIGLFLAAALPLARDTQGEIYDTGGHFVAGVTFFGSTAFALIVLALAFRREPGWRDLSTYAGVAGLLAVAGFVVLGRLAIPDGAPLHEYGGLLQRLLILLVTFPCLVVIGSRLWRRSAVG